MGFTRHYIKDLQFMLTMLEGELTDEDLSQHMECHNVETKDMLQLRELADCRRVTGLDQLSVSGTMDGARLGLPKDDAVLALLIDGSELQFGMATVFQTIAMDSVFAVEIFQDEELALEWLLGDENERQRARELMASV